MREKFGNPRPPEPKTPERVVLDRVDAMVEKMALPVEGDLSVKARGIYTISFITGPIKPGYLIFEVFHQPDEGTSWRQITLSDSPDSLQSILIVLSDEDGLSVGSWISETSDDADEIDIKKATDLLDWLEPRIALDSFPLYVPEATEAQHSLDSGQTP